MDRSIVTLITGASSGIGRESAVLLSKSRQLILHGRDLAHLEETRSRCRQPSTQLLWQQDLQAIDQIGVGLSQFLGQNNLGIEGFVHCAGALKVLRLRNIERTMAQTIMDVNFTSAVEIVRLLIRTKINEKHLRSVVFVSSTASMFGARGFNLYCASKGALDAFMRAIAVELAPDIRVNSVLPGAVETAMTAAMLDDPEIRKRMEEGYPLGIGKPEDIASAVEFLLSNKARWITGQQLVVDGGRTVNITA